MAEDEADDTVANRTRSPLVSRFPWFSNMVGGRPDIRTCTGPSHCLSGFLNGLRSFERETLLNPDSKEGLNYRHLLDVVFLGRQLKVKPTHKRNPQEWAALGSLLFTYRLADVVAVTEAAQLSLPTPIPQTPKVGPKAPLPFYSKLGDWTALLRAFKAAYVAERGRITPVFQGNSSLRLVKTIARCGSQGNLSNISANLFTAALHLSYLMHHQFQEGQLPELTNNFEELIKIRLGSQNQGLSDFVLNKDEVAYWESVVGTSTERSDSQVSTTSGRERQPLLFALGVSPSYLMVPFQLTQASFGGENLLATCMALGNQRPSALRKSDKVIWTALFQIAAEIISPEEGLDFIVNNLPWAELSSCSEEERRWFKVSTNASTVTSAQTLAALPSHFLSAPVVTMAVAGSRQPLFSALAEEESDDDMDTDPTGVQTEAILDKADEIEENRPPPVLQADQIVTEWNDLCASASTSTAVAQPLSLSPRFQGPSVDTTVTAAEQETPNRQSRSPSPNSSDMEVDVEEQHPGGELLAGEGRIIQIVGGGLLDGEELLVERELKLSQGEGSESEDEPQDEKMKESDDQEKESDEEEKDSDDEEKESDEEEKDSDDKADGLSDEEMKDASDQLMRDEANKATSKANATEKTVPQGSGSVPQTRIQDSTVHTQLNEPRTRGQAAAAARASTIKTQPNEPRTRGQAAAAAQADAKAKAEAEAQAKAKLKTAAKPKVDLLKATSKNAATPPRLPPPPPVTPASVPSVGDKRKQLNDASAAPDLKRQKSSDGSKNRPIDVDAYVLLNPTQSARRNPAKVELQPTLSTPTARYTTAKPFEVLDGKLITHKIFPRVHNKEELIRLDHVWQSVMNSYVDGKPLLVSDPDKSIFRVITHAERDRLGHSGVQKILKRQCLLVTEMPSKAMSFDKNGLRSLAPLDSVVQFQDLSLPVPSSNMSDRLVFGKVSQLLESTTAPELLRKTLNGLSFPMASSGSNELEPHASCGVAWTNTSVSIFKAEVGRPAADTNWGLAATEGAITDWHIDTNGFGTLVKVRTGSKLWMVSSNAREELAKIGSFLTEGFELDEPPRNFSTEAILLTPDTEMYMCAGVAHLVYTPSNTICHGSHFYSTSFMQDTLVSYIHGFICHSYITNISHPNTQVLFRRLMHFYHRGLIQQTDLTDDEAAHLPDLLQKDGKPLDLDDVMNFLSLCILNLFSNALDQRTYKPPGAQEGKRPSPSQRKVMEGSDANSITQAEREEMIEARGVSLDAFAWFRRCFDVRQDGKAGSVDLVSIYVVQVARRLLRYKRAASVNGIKSASVFGTAELEVQVEAALKLDQRSWKLWTAEHQGRWLDDDLKSTSKVKIGAKATVGVDGFVEVENDVPMEEGEIRPLHDHRLAVNPVSFSTPYEAKDFKWKEESFRLDNARSYRAHRNSAVYQPASRKWTETGATDLDRRYRGVMEWFRVETAEKVRSRWDIPDEEDVKLNK